MSDTKTDTKINRLDTSGTCCPMPMVNTNRAIRELAPGEVLEVIATDPATAQDIPSWCARMGHTLVEQSSEDGVYRYVVRRG